MEDFVTYELAVKLREKGFREDCIAYYLTDGELLYNRDQYRGGDYKSLLNSYNSLPRNLIGCEPIDAPTISQVLKWLREENEIYINIVSYFSYAPKNNVAFAFCARYKEGDDWRDVEINESYLTYEKCALSSIEYVLDNLI